MKEVQHIKAILKHIYGMFFSVGIQSTECGSTTVSLFSGAPMGGLSHPRDGCTHGGLE